MANRNFANSRIYSGHVMPVLIDCSINIGASGAVGTVTGPYIKSVTRQAAGVYQIQVQPNFSRFYIGNAQMVSPQTVAAAVDPNTLSPGAIVRISTVGDTNWSSAGLPAGVTAAVGVSFVLSAAPAAGTGRVKLVGNSGIDRVELVGDPNLTCAPMVANSPAAGAIILLQCLASGSPADPADGSILKVSMLFSNSSIVINGA